MARDGKATREKILDLAQRLALDHGFGGMSVDQVIAAAGVTKGAFFHHFKSKNDLAKALIERYVAADNAILHEHMSRAEHLSQDPLQQYLIFVGLLEEMIAGMEQPNPGCLVASFIYQMELFTEETQGLVVNGFKEWEKVLGDKIDKAIERHEPKIPVTSHQIYNNLLAIFEGGFVLARMYEKNSALSEQIGQHKLYVELLFGQYDH